MYEKLKTSFDHIRAEPDLKAGTREFLYRKMSEQPARPAAHRNLLAAAACLAFMLMGFCGGYWVYFTPVSAISIDVNPSVEFQINRFDKVLSVAGYNDGGMDLASGLDVRFMDYMDAIDQVLSGEAVTECLSRDEVLSIMVSSADEARQSEMLANVERYAAGHHNVRCGMCGYKDMTYAHSHGLSFGKYQAFLELQALDPSITPEDVQGCTMREIQDRINALSGTGPDGGRGESGRHGQGGGYGHGHG